MFEVQEALDAQKELYLRHKDAFRRREEALRRKDVELQDSLIKFNKFLQENESKRKRAITRVAEERRHIELKELDIERLREQRHKKGIDVLSCFLCYCITHVAVIGTQFRARSKTEQSLPRVFGGGVYVPYRRLPGNSRSFEPP